MLNGAPSNGHATFISQRLLIRGMSSTVTISTLYREIKKIEQRMVTKDQLENWMETLDIMSNPNTMRQLRQSEEDIKHGRVKRISSVKDLLREC